MIEQRAAHHPLSNPCQHPANQGLRPVTRDDCPKTLENQARTVYLPLNLTKEKPCFEHVAEAAYQAAIPA